MQKELEVAIEAAYRAGKVLRSMFEKGVQVHYKGRVDLVTTADFESEKTIIETIHKAFPDHGIYAEESGIKEGTQPLRWIIDPLDGTTNFAHNFPLFAVSIALEHEEEMMLGVVYNPISDEMFTAARGEGSRKNDKPIQVSDTEDLIHSLVVTGFPYDRSEVSSIIELWTYFTLHAQGVRRLGSASLDLCYVAAGQMDAYYERYVFPWDIAAGAIIVQEAGGKVTDFYGGKFTSYKNEIVASNGKLHEAMISITSRV